MDSYSSLELLSTMSPKIRQNNVNKKGPSKLALNRNIRRSSIRRSISFDQVLNKLNDDTVVIIEYSDSESDNSNRIIQHKNSNNEPIFISETEEESCDNDNNRQMINDVNVQKVNNEIKSVDIKKWLIDVDNAQQKSNTNDCFRTPKTKQLSDSEDNVIDTSAEDILNKLYGPTWKKSSVTKSERKPNIKTKPTSTLFKTSKTELKPSHHPFECKINTIVPNSSSKKRYSSSDSSSSNENDQIDLLNKRIQLQKSEPKFKTKPVKNLLLKTSKTEMRPNPYLEKEQLRTKKSNYTRKQLDFSDDSDCENDKNESNTLVNKKNDNLYGTSWRNNKDDLLLKSEPKTIKVKNHVPKSSKTEMRPNPYLEKEQLRTKKSNYIRKQLDFSDDSDYENDKNESNTLVNKKNDNLYGTSWRNNKDDLLLKSEPKFKTATVNDRLFKTSKTELRPNPYLEKEQLRTKKSSYTRKQLDFSDDSDYENDKNKANTLFIRNNLKVNSTNENKKTDRNFQSCTPGALFLISLSAELPSSYINYDVTALMYKKDFKKRKEDLAAKLFKIFNENVFENVIHPSTPLKWSNKKIKTAGSCILRQINHKDKDIERNVEIILSIKVLDSADRLRDTLLHEMCHAATWIKDKIDDGHGPHWKAWTRKAKLKYPEIPEVTVRHTYDIKTKYVYKCQKCGYCIYRHSKSLNTQTKCCGYCRGRFEVMLNKRSIRGSLHPVPVKPKREIKGFARFVKENYAIYQSPSRKHGDIMKILGNKYTELKIN